MKRIIDGKRYDTETARKLVDLYCSHFAGDFQHHATALYRTSKGAFFLAGSGGPMSMWARSLGNNSTGGGEGIRPLDDDEAREILERENAITLLEELFTTIQDA